MQLYISLNPADLADMSTTESCASDVSRWFVENALLLNLTKTELWFLAQVNRRHKSTNHKVSALPEWRCSLLTTSSCLEWRSTQHCPLTSISSMSLSSVITTFMHCILYNHCWCWIQSKQWLLLLSAADSTTATVYLVNRMSQANINKLQCVQNVLARVVAGASWTVSSTDIRGNLHWLPVSHRVTFKLCLSTWKTLHTAQPPTCLNLSPATIHPEPCVLPTQIFWPDLPASLLIFLLEHFLFPHHQLGIHCLHISALLTNHQPSNVN